MRPENGSRSGTIEEDSSTEPPWIHTTAGRVASPASRQCRRTPFASVVSGTRGPFDSDAPMLEALREPRHRIRADPVDDGDEEVELERLDLAVVDDLRGLGEVH